MLFEKLFRVLVLGGAMVAATSGCAANAQAPAPQKKAEPRDGGTAAPDAGTAKPADSGGGAPGW